MNRHDTDALSLAFGSGFLALVCWWLLSRWVNATAPGPGWFLAGALLLFGALGIVTTLRPQRGRKTVDPPRDQIHRSAAGGQ
jgi:hypothetical protein